MYFNRIWILIYIYLVGRAPGLRPYRCSQGEIMSCVPNVKVYSNNEWREISNASCIQIYACMCNSVLFDSAGVATKIVLYKIASYMWILIWINHQILLSPSFFLRCRIQGGSHFVETYMLSSSHSSSVTSVQLEIDGAGGGSHLCTPWGSYQIRKNAGCACAGNAGNVFAPSRLQMKSLVSDPGMHHGTCVTHVPWCMSGSPTRGGGENVPGIPGACAPAILRIWQEAHGDLFKLTIESLTLKSDIYQS